jgi:glycosyltransferase involved in cell wall biosynthesis
MSFPSVTVVIPTRDRPALLRRAIRDIVAQTYPGPVEVVVVFDQSEPDTTLARCGLNRVVRVVPNERTPGLAGARNAGIVVATGDLIAFCDDDDEWLPGKLAAQVAALDAAAGPAIATCGIYVRRDGKTMLRMPNEEQLRYEDFLDDRIMEVNPCTILLDRHLLTDQIGLVDETLPGSYAEDYEWLLRAAKVAPFVLVPEPLTLIHWGAGSFFAARWWMIHDALDAVVAKHPDLRGSRRGLARIRGQQAFAMAAVGERRRALELAREAARLNPSEPRTVAAALVATGLVSAGRVVRAANSVGRGI